MPPPKNRSSRKGDRHSSSNNQQKNATRSKVKETEVTTSARLLTVQEPGESEISVVIDQKDVKSIEIDGKDEISSVAYFPDGEHIVGGGYEGKIRCWRVSDGKEVETPMDTGDVVCSIAVSPDGMWIVSGTAEGQVMIWNAVSYEKVYEFSHELPVHVLDISTDATTLATTSYDECACLWSLESIPPSPQSLGIVGSSDPLQPYHRQLAAFKFSPDGRLFAAATWVHDYLRIYGIRDRPPLFTFPIDVSSHKNQSLAWATSNKQLFALSHDGDIHCLDVSMETTLSKWPIHNKDPGCISLASNDAFIAASANSSVSFWDTTTHKQIGPIIHHSAHIECMAISIKYSLVVGGGDKITLWNLLDILPFSYFDDLTKLEIRRKRTEVHLSETTLSLHTQDDQPDEKFAPLENALQELSDLQHETVRSLRAELDTQKIASLKKTRELEKTNWELRQELADSQKELAAHKQDIENLSKLFSEMMFPGAAERFADPR